MKITRRTIVYGTGSIIASGFAFLSGKALIPSPLNPVSTYYVYSGASVMLAGVALTELYIGENRIIGDKNRNN